MYGAAGPRAIVREDIAVLKVKIGPQMAELSSEGMASWCCVQSSRWYSEVVVVRQMVVVDGEGGTASRERRPGGLHCLFWFSWQGEVPDAPTNSGL